MIMEQSNIAKIFKALSCDQRVKLLELMQEWEKCPTCCDGVSKAFTRASQELNISRSTLSHHFKELENAGLIHCVKVGQSTECKINQEALHKVRSFMKE